MYLGVDYGMAKIGLATADDASSKAVAVPLKIIQASPHFKAVSEIIKICEEYAVSKIIIGFPYQQQAKLESKTTKSLNHFITLLEKAASLPIIIIDEQVTTKVAQKLMKDFPTPKKKIDDAIAAQVILQSYVDTLHARTG